MRNGVLSHVPTFSPYSYGDGANDACAEAHSACNVRVARSMPYIGCLVRINGGTFGGSASRRIGGSEGIQRPKWLVRLRHRRHGHRGACTPRTRARSPLITPSRSHLVLSLVRPPNTTSKMGPTSRFNDFRTSHRQGCLHRQQPGCLRIVTALAILGQRPNHKIKEKDDEIPDF